MKKTADLLYLLSTFSVRAGFIQKATIYAATGFKLFPRDHRLVEMHAYVLILTQNYDDAAAVLAQTDLSTRNLNYLRGRLSILGGKPKGEVQQHLRAYLVG